MPLIRTAAVLLAALALAMPNAADAKRKHGKGWKKKGPRAAWVHRVDRRDRLERDLARLIAARPRLADGSRIVQNSPSRAVVQRVASTTRVLRSAPAVVDQRRTDAVSSFLQRHPPPAL